MKSTRRDANYREGMTGHGDHLPQNFWISAKPMPPHPFAQNNHRCVFFPGKKTAAQPHVNLRDAEKVRCGRLPPDALRLSLATN